jgi:hypothetical protein
MANTTDVTVGADAWTAIGGASPAAISIKSNTKDTHWHLAVKEGGAPAASLIGEVYRGEESWEGYSITGQVYVRVERGSVQFAVTE